MIRKLRQWWMGLWARLRPGRYVELVATPEVEQVAHIDPPVSGDDRRKQRRRLKLSSGFIDGLDEIHGKLMWQCGKSRPRRRLLRELSPVNAVLSGPIMDLLDKHRLSDELIGVGPSAPVDLARMSNVRTTHLARFNEDPGDRLSADWYVEHVRRASFRDLHGRHVDVGHGAQIFEHRMLTRICRADECHRHWWITRDNGETWHSMTSDERGRPQIKRLEDLDADGQEVLGIHRFQCAMAMRNGADLIWRLLLRRGPLTIEFHCRESLARELIALRDSNEKRRPAALHWVAQHTRQLDEERKVAVKAHLRGQREFPWGGWTCYLVEADIDRAAHDLGVLPQMELDARAG